MFNVEKITTLDQTVRVATSVENVNLITNDPSVLDRYTDSAEEKLLQASKDIISERTKPAHHSLWFCS